VNESASNRRALALCYGGMMCIAIGTSLIPVFLTSFSDAFGGGAGLTDEQLGRISAIMFAGFTAGILGGGPLADRWGAKGFALLGAALTMGGLAVTAAAHSYGALLAASVLLGLGAGVLDMVMSPIVSALRPDRRTEALNWLHAFYCVGSVATVLFCSAGLHFGMTWRTITLLMIAAPAIVFAGFLPLHVPALVHEDAERTPLRRLFSSAGFVAGLAIIFLAGAAEQGIVQWLPAYAERGLGFSKTVGGVTLAAYSVLMIAGRMLAAVAARRIRAVPLMRGACALLAACILVACFAPRGVALAACILTGWAVSCLWPTTLGLVADRFPHGGASMFALLAGLGNSGCIVMPWVIGFVAEHSQLRLGLATTVLCPLAIIVLLAAIRR